MRKSLAEWTFDLCIFFHFSLHIYCRTLQSQSKCAVLLLRDFLIKRKHLNWIVLCRLKRYSIVITSWFITLRCPAAITQTNRFDAINYVCCWNQWHDDNGNFCQTKKHDLLSIENVLFWCILMRFLMWW